MVGMELDRERIPSAYLLLEMSAPLDATLSPLISFQPLQTPQKFR